MHNTSGFYTLVERECYRFLRLSRQTIVPPIITTVMFILIFGYSLGSRITEIHGVPYILYILPGLLQMGVINNAYANTSSSLFMSRMERSIENLLVSPLHYSQIVSAYAIGGILRGLVVGATVLATSAFFIDMPAVHWPLLFVSIILTSLLFAALGIVSALRADTWDNIATFTNFVLTPFVYLGGVFYSVDMLPPFWSRVSHFNPVFYCVDVVRHAFLGHSDAPVWLSLAVIGGMATLIFAVCVALFRRGYKIMN